MTSWSQGNSFTAAPGLPFYISIRHTSIRSKSYHLKLLTQIEERLDERLKLGV
jgi:trans-2-enoyl-CoA reductase